MSVFTYDGLTGFIGVVLQSPIAICLIIMLVVKYFMAGKPIKEVEGSLVRHIDNNDEWNQLMDESNSTGKFVVVDFYATWCPPCKTAAPRFGQMSIGELKRIINIITDKSTYDCI